MTKKNTENNVIKINEWLRERKKRKGEDTYVLDDRVARMRQSIERINALIRDLRDMDNKQ